MDALEPHKGNHPEKNQKYAKQKGRARDQAYEQTFAGHKRGFDLLFQSGVGIFFHTVVAGGWNIGHINRIG
jgi:hypothetical protein